MTYDYLITGGSGFIGTNLRNRLVATFISYDIKDPIPHDIVNNEISDQADKLIHLASLTNVRESLLFPVSFISDNIKGLLNCLMHLYTAGAESLTFTSSLNAASSLSPYLASKASCENICKAFKASYGLDIKVIKLSNVYGPHSLHKNSVVAQFIKCCISGAPMKIIGDGTQQRDFVYVNDVVDAILNGYEGPVSAGVSTSITDLAQKINYIAKQLIGTIVPIYYTHKSNPGEVVVSKSSNPYPNATSLDEGLWKTFTWFMENYDVK